MQNQTEPKKHTIKFVIFFFVLLALVAFFYLNTRSNDNHTLDSFMQSDELATDQAHNSDHTTTTNPFNETSPASSQNTPAKKQLTKEERMAVMTTVIDAATQDIANAKEQLTLAKAAGNTTEVAEIQQRLDHMRAVLKRALEKHDDLGLDYPHALFE